MQRSYYLKRRLEVLVDGVEELDVDLLQVVRRTELVQLVVDLRSKELIQLNANLRDIELVQLIVKVRSIYNWFNSW